LTAAKRKRQRRGKGRKHPSRLPKESKTIRLLTRIDRQVKVLRERLPRVQVSSVYGKRLHLVLRPFVVKGTFDNVELSRSTTLLVSVPYDVLDRTLEEAEVSPDREVIGIMLGSFEGEMIAVSTSVSGEARSSMHAELSAEELARLLDRGKLRDPNAKFVGWYHSHLGHGVVPSKLDLRTQSVLQQFSPSIFALIVDPKSKELEVYVTEALRRTDAEISEDLVRFKLPVSQPTEKKS
jgi:proteasome lid subunit RPN8/RPN11